ncbi:MAG: hypothetical protein U1E14_04500 [Geminicoccaceae bacterium]
MRKDEPHPWLQPLSRRIVIVAICVVWTAFEAWNEPGGMWFWMFLAITGWGAWDLLLSGKYRQQPAAPAPPEG